MVATPIKTWKRGSSNPRRKHTFFLQFIITSSNTIKWVEIIPHLNSIKMDQWGAIFLYCEYSATWSWYKYGQGYDIHSYSDCLWTSETCQQLMLKWQSNVRYMFYTTYAAYYLTRSCVWVQKSGRQYPDFFFIPLSIPFSQLLYYLAVSSTPKAIFRKMSFLHQNESNRVIDRQTFGMTEAGAIPKSIGCVAASP